MLAHLAVALTGSAMAQFTPLTGNQSMSGAVAAPAGAPPSQSFSLVAPAPLASWAPSPQDISVTQGIAHARVQAAFASVIEPGRITAAISAETEAWGSTIFGPATAEFTYDALFQLSFSVAEPTEVVLRARHDRIAENWGYANHAQDGVTFGRVGHAPLIALVTSPPPATPPLVSLVYEPRLVTLDPGTYEVHAFTSEHWGAGGTWACVNSTTFALDTCYPDCNADGSLTVADFGCFQTRYVAGALYADCDGAGGLTVADFGCFETKFVAGCP